MHSAVDVLTIGIVVGGGVLLLLISFAIGLCLYWNGCCSRPARGAAKAYVVVPPQSLELQPTPPQPQRQHNDTVDANAVIPISSNTAVF